jgi:predicted SnoaL-like aldol condensation-catalyzing enzyme
LTNAVRSASVLSETSVKAYLSHDGAMNHMRSCFRAFCAIVLVLGCTRAAPSTSQQDTEANRQVVLAFYTEGLVGKQPRLAFERHMSADFVEHKPDVPAGTREATIAFLEELMKGMPDPRWEVIRTVAEHDMVFLHARFTPAAGAPPYAIADVFRLRDGKIVEHWDVVAGPPADARNPNSRF